MRISLVVPTVGRASLHDLLVRLPPDGPEIIVVDDRPEHQPALPLPANPRVKLVNGFARGPAAARNLGWRAAKGEWIVFLDDDVVPAQTWWQDLQSDLQQPGGVAGVQGWILVPAGDRTDWAANTARLADGIWVTADMAYRRDALERVGGFDERFPRAYREDADLAYRVRQKAGQLVLGQRQTMHPVREESRWISLRTQRGNADDALLRRLYGPDWHRRLRIPQGRRRMHALTTAAALITVAYGLARLLSRRPSRSHDHTSRRQDHSIFRDSAASNTHDHTTFPENARILRLPPRPLGAGFFRRSRALAQVGLIAARSTPPAAKIAAVAGATWALATAEFVVARRRNAPAEPLVSLIATSVLIPPLAIGHWLRGWWHHRQVKRWS